MRVRVLGTGRVGSGLARQLHAAGHGVLLGPRDPLAEGRGGWLGVAGRSYRDAAEHGELIVVAVPWWGVGESLQAAGDLTGKVVVNVTNPDTDQTYTQLHEFLAPRVCSSWPPSRPAPGWSRAGTTPTRRSCTPRRLGRAARGSVPVRRRCAGQAAGRRA